MLQVYRIQEFSTFGSMKIGSDPEVYGRQDSGYPRSPLTLETRDIRKNYKYLKEEMPANHLLDYLVQCGILETDENSLLMSKCRAVKCDFILRKLLRHPERLQDFTSLVLSGEEEEFECFRTLGNSPPSPRPSALEKQFPFEEGLTPSAVRRNLTNKKTRKHFIREISKRTSSVSASIVDDFLEEDVISVSDHEQISRLKNTDEAAERIFHIITNKEPIVCLKLLSILQSYADRGDRYIGNLLSRLRQSAEGENEQEDAEYKDMTVELEEGKLSFSSKDLKVDNTQKVELKITEADGKERILVFPSDFIIRVIPDTEEMVAQGAHSTFGSTSIGSIIIRLQAESTDAMTKLKHFIENEDISKFLTRLFESSNVQRLLTTEKYRIDVQIRKVHVQEQQTAVDTFRPEVEFKYSACLRRCHGFLLEELEPQGLLRDKEVAGIFRPVLDQLKQLRTRTAKAEIFLEFLKDQPEDKIKLVMEKLKEKNMYLYGQLFPNIQKYQDIDVELVRRNILDSLTELLNEVSILAVQTPFLSTGFVSVQELDSLHTNYENTRTKGMEFIKMVLHRGETAVKVFLCALETACGEDRVQSLLVQKDVCSESKDVGKHPKIKYEAFNEENGLLFKGRFVLELRKNAGDEKQNEECLYAREEEGPTEREHSDSQSGESSSESDPDTTPKKDTPGNTSNKDIWIAKLDSDCSEILSRLTTKLGRVEDVRAVKNIFSKQSNDYVLMDEVRRMYPRKYEEIREDCMRLHQTLKELQRLTGSVISDTNDEFGTGEQEEDIARRESDTDDESDTGEQGDTMQIPRHEPDLEIVSRSDTISHFERQATVKSTDEYSGDTTESHFEEDTEEDLVDLNRRSSKYQGLLTKKLYNSEKVQSVMNVFRDMAEKDTQLMAIKNLLNEEQYKKLEKYIIKLQDISDKLQRKSDSADVA